MRRQDIQLLALARQGDAAARAEAGRRYLVGGDGFPRHVATGMEYLAHPAVRDRPETARIIAESLPLQDLVQLDQEEALRKAAAADSLLAQFKLGVWTCLLHSRVDAGLSWLQAAAAGGQLDARAALAAQQAAPAGQALLALLRAVEHSAALNLQQVAVMAARRAHEAGSLDLLGDSLQIALALAARLTHGLSDLVVAALRMAEARGRALRGLTPEHLEAALELAVSRGDRDAACLMGRALCGIASGPLAPGHLVGAGNMRKGVALLLRAADAGRDDAWMDLYATHADHRLSVSNPQMARFFLEKAASLGQPRAQRKLGALMLRSSASLAESEQAIGWLHAAAGQGDRHARGLLESLVLPVPGDAAAAQAAIEQVRASDPWLALRLTLARDFGLTKLEALSVDPVDGRRPWGLLVGRNPFITQARLSAPRAVPALTETALRNLARAASFFEQSRGEHQALEGDLRRRSLRQRRCFERLGLSDALFFAEASSVQLEAIRQGPKWAYRAREPLALALAD